MKRYITLVFCALITTIHAQTVIPVGQGSYASSVPTSEQYYNADFLAANVNVMPGETRPIPTNDWWTDVLFNDLAGQLWAYPFTVNPENYGFELFSPTFFHNGDTWLNDPCRLQASGFSPNQNIAMDWSDWSVKVRLTDGAQHMDVTLVHGAPYLWVETTGIDPQINFTNGSPSFYTSTGGSVNFPFSGDHLGYSYLNVDYSLSLAPGATATFSNNILTIEQPNDESFFVLGTMTTEAALSDFHAHAYAKPILTTVTPNYDPTAGKLTAVWEIVTEDLITQQNNPTIQGFLPHQYRDAITDFNYESWEYQVNHGKMKTAIGNSFAFTYDFNGVLSHLPAPAASDVTNPFDPVKMKAIYDDYFNDAGNYGNDTYWGAKDLVTMAKYASIADQMDYADAPEMLAKARTALVDWFTYTPGESEKYFARYENWGALVGYDPSYGSEQFTDNHFHYGYHTYAAALVGALDPDFANDYGDMAKLVARHYANWEHDNTDFPFMRTFDPWVGHSYAGGKSGGTGNNQESTSESIQGWAGVFLLGELLGDDDMRTGGAFGYLMESRATLEYWLDWKK